MSGISSPHFSAPAAAATKRATNIDLCRGLLFVLMANTHVLSVLGVPYQHFLFSDWWLPGGWATAVFVVLSGFSVGFVCSDRKDMPALERALRRRSKQILFVMLFSNAVFAALREIVAGKAALILDAHWWIGFLTLDTPWTISGVLLPTAVVVALGIPLSRLARQSHWLLLPLLLTLHLACVAIRIDLLDSPYAQAWIVRLLFLEGLAGFPLLPFVLNGLIGVWLGVLRNRDELKWRSVIVMLMALQVGVYLTSYIAPALWVSVFVAACGPVGKFAWMYLIAHLLKLSKLMVERPIELIGNFALGSFVMHRFFLHALNIVMGWLGVKSVPLELQYALLLLATLVLTWGLCVLRKRYLKIDLPFRRLAM